MQRVRVRENEAAPPTPAPPIWTYRSLADYWQVNEWTIRSWVRKKRLAVMRLGGPDGTTIRISDEERRRFEREAINADCREVADDPS